MILYLDTSAIVKKYFKEQGSIEVIRLWKRTSSIVTSTVAYAETLAAIHLASALIVQQRIDEEFVFACYDKSLNESAGKEGLITLL